ncbi:MAG: DUF393 domain-containing protein [Planctomycetota bacterium]
MSSDSPPPTAPTVAPFECEVFYDGDCPLCRKEIAMIRRMDHRERIRFTDIAADGFVPADYGKTMDELMAEIHGRDAEGRWIVGVEVFRKLYGAVGFGPVVAATRLPGVRHVLDLAYKVFAKQRLRLTGRCNDGACEVQPSSTPASRDSLQTTS